MKLCITSQGGDIAASVDPRFGRAAFFVVIDTDTMQYEIFENMSIQASGGAGISAAKAVIDSGAKAVLTGDCGPNAFRTLQAANIAVYTGVSGSVQQAVDAFKQGDMKPVSQASVDSHNGMSPQG